MQADGRPVPGIFLCHGRPAVVEGISALQAGNVEEPGQGIGGVIGKQVLGFLQGELHIALSGNQNNVSDIKIGNRVGSSPTRQFHRVGTAGRLGREGGFEGTFHREDGTSLLKEGDGNRCVGQTKYADLLSTLENSAV